MLGLVKLSITKLWKVYCWVCQSEIILIYGKITLYAPGRQTAKSRWKCTHISPFCNCQICTDLKKILLKYVTTVPCNLSLIIALVCECCSSSDVKFSQGSVVTHMRCGGVFNKYFAANLLENQTVKKVWKLVENLRVNRVTTISLVSPFFGTRCMFFNLCCELV